MVDRPPVTHHFVTADELQNTGRRAFLRGVTPREMFWQITSCGCYVQYVGKFKMKWLDDKFCRPASLAQFRGWRTDCEYGERSLSPPLYHTITHQHLRNLSAAAQKER